MTQRTNYKRFVCHDYLADVDMEEDHVNMPSIERFQDGGYESCVVTNYDEWEEIIADFKKDGDGRNEKSTTV